MDEEDIERIRIALKNGVDMLPNEMVVEIGEIIQDETLGFGDSPHDIHSRNIYPAIIEFLEEAMRDRIAKYRK